MWSYKERAQSKKRSRRKSQNKSRENRYHRTEFSIKLLTQRKLPKVLLSNVQSLKAKIDELRLIAKINELDLICFTETWLTEEIEDCIMSIPGYAFNRNDRKGKKVVAQLSTCISVRISISHSLTQVNTDPQGSVLGP